MKKQNRKNKGFNPATILAWMMIIVLISVGIVYIFMLKEETKKENEKQYFDNSVLDNAEIKSQDVYMSNETCYPINCPCYNLSKRTMCMTYCYRCNVSE
jgi:archaellum component FlaF (FlaF/FlaG flagellin family)